MRAFILVERGTLARCKVPYGKSGNYIFMTVFHSLNRDCGGTLDSPIVLLTSPPPIFPLSSLKVSHDVGTGAPSRRQTSRTILLDVIFELSVHLIPNAKCGFALDELT